jgi:hypothetical protein
VLNDVLFGRTGRAAASSRRHPRGDGQERGAYRGSQVGREIFRGVLGSILGKKR